MRDLSTRPFGRTDMTVTPTGFGAWAIGGGGYRWGWSTQDDGDSVAAIRHAVDHGVTWIDTAPIYGLGHSEEVVGRAVKDLGADAPMVFDKCGMVWDAANPNGDATVVGDPASIRRECEASLGRLGVERIDLFQMHWPAGDGTPVEDYWGEMMRLREEGKVRAIGLCNHPVELLERAEAVTHVESVQPPFSAIKRSAAAQVIPWALAHGTAVISYSPMQAGLLTGSFSLDRVRELPDDDWRKAEPEYRGDDVERSLALAELMRPVAERHGVMLGAVAIAWVLQWPGITGAIVGARSPSQVDGWIPAATLTLSEVDLAEITHAIKATGAGEGPIEPVEIEVAR